MTKIILIQMFKKRSFQLQNGGTMTSKNIYIYY